MESVFEVPQRLRAGIRGLADQAPLPQPLSPERRAELIEHIKVLLKERDAVLVAHYYVDETLQALAEETGGHVADSLEMANFGSQHPATTLVVIGVRFMGETAKILNPEKRVLMPDLRANCSLDLACPADAFTEACDAHPDRTSVVYANTSAAVKARTDWVVTSGNGLQIVRHLAERGEKILWAPDKHLGHYIQQETGADMLLWDGSCVVHEEFRADALKKLMEENPEAQVLVHPESPAAVVDLADVVGSTSRLIRAVQESPSETLIVATDFGIFHKMREVAPHKRLLVAPTGGEGGTCTSCAHCPWMAMNGLENLAAVLESGANEILIDEAIRQKAYRSVKRMLDFSREQGLVGGPAKCD